MFICGTDEACQGCPLRHEFEGEIGSIDSGFNVAETLGQAATRIAGEYRYSIITEDEAKLALLALGLPATYENGLNLRLAVSRQAAGDCK